MAGKNAFEIQLGSLLPRSIEITNLKNNGCTIRFYKKSSWNQSGTKYFTLESWIDNPAHLIFSWLFPVFTPCLGLLFITEIPLYIYFFILFTFPPCCSMLIRNSCLFKTLEYVTLYRFWFHGAKRWQPAADCECLSQRLRPEAGFLLKEAALGILCPSNWVTLIVEFRNWLI